VHEAQLPETDTNTLIPRPRHLPILPKWDRGQGLNGSWDRLESKAARPRPHPYQKVLLWKTYGVPGLNWSNLGRNRLGEQKLKVVSTIFTGKRACCLHSIQVTDILVYNVTEW